MQQRALRQLGLQACQRLGGITRVGGRKDDGELQVVHPPQGILRAQGAAHQPRHMGQCGQLGRRQVLAGQVRGRQRVQLQRGQADMLRMALGAGHFRLQGFLQALQVQGARQRVVAGAALELGQDIGQLGNLALLGQGLGAQIFQLGLGHAVFGGQGMAGLDHGFQHLRQAAQVLGLLDLLGAVLQGLGMGGAELAQAGQLAGVLAQQLLELLVGVVAGAFDLQVAEQQVLQVRLHRVELCQGPGLLHGACQRLGLLLQGLVLRGDGRNVLGHHAQHGQHALPALRLVLGGEGQPVAVVVQHLLQRGQRRRRGAQKSGQLVGQLVHALVFIAQHGQGAFHHARHLVGQGRGQDVHGLGHGAGRGQQGGIAQVQLGEAGNGALQAGPVFGFHRCGKLVGDAFLRRGLGGQNAGDAAQRWLGEGQLGQQAGDFFVNGLVIFRGGGQPARSQQLQGVACNFSG